MFLLEATDVLPESIYLRFRLAKAYDAKNKTDEAIRVCRRGLELDRFHDPLWRVLIAARDQAGDAGAASRDRREYASILEGLGLSPELAATSA